MDSSTQATSINQLKGFPTVHLPQDNPPHEVRPSSAATNPENYVDRQRNYADGVTRVEAGGSGNRGGQTKVVPCCSCCGIPIILSADMAVFILTIIFTIVLMGAEKRLFSLIFLIVACIITIYCLVVNIFRCKNKTTIHPMVARYRIGRIIVIGSLIVLMIIGFIILRDNKGRDDMKGITPPPNQQPGTSSPPPQPPARIDSTDQAQPPPPTDDKDRPRDPKRGLMPFAGGLIILYIVLLCVSQCYFRELSPQQASGQPQQMPLYHPNSTPTHR